MEPILSANPAGSMELNVQIAELISPAADEEVLGNHLHRKISI